MKNFFIGLLFCLSPAFLLAAPVDQYIDPTGAIQILQPSNSLYSPNGISLTSRAAPGAGTLAASTVSASTGITTGTLSVSGTLSGAGISTYLASPPAIGGTAAAAGSFTTLNATQSIITTTSGGTPFCAGLSGCTSPLFTMTLNGTGGTTLNMQSRPAGNGTLFSFGSSNTDEGAILLSKGAGNITIQNNSSVSNNSAPTFVINNSDNTSGAGTSTSIRHGGRDIGILSCFSEDTSTLTGNCSFFAFNAGTATRAWRADKSGNVGIKASIGAPQASLDVQGGQFLVRGGSAPTISSCGTSPVAPSGSDASFTFTSGSGALTSCVINFGTTWLTAPKTCHLQPMNAAAALQQTTGAYVSGISTTQLTITGLNLTSVAYGVKCH